MVLAQDSGLRTQDSALRPVAVTGLGVVSPLGVGRVQFWDALCAGRSGIAPLPDAAGVPHVAARILNFSPREFITSGHLRRADALSRTIVAASRMALADAKLGAAMPASERIGVVVGSELGNISESVQYLDRLFAKGPALASPLMFPNLVLNAPASYVAMEMGCTGANLTVSQGQASGEQAIATGCDLIRTGRADVVLAGGGDELAEMVIATYRRFRALSSQRGGPEWCSPYDADRNGIVLGEGTAMLVLEPLHRARQRGATIYAEIADVLSFGVAAPTYGWPRRAPTAAPRLRRFLDGAAQSVVDLVCGGANSSRCLDAYEIDILTHLFGHASPAVPLTSIKGAIGEFGAAGALTAVAACLALHEGAVPPLCELRRPLVAENLRFAARTAEPHPLRSVLQLSLARGGAAIALLLRRLTE
ncbi:MAG TPA: beta-ketoacyl synthase N-terminal-like domain-containing protein [Candidatus Acidoferrales bacterium]|nr:beta-ketoacyl synthase N-terminal-like domain-containing protein [Candidatus Acidoferrales bacterium]